MIKDSLKGHYEMVGDSQINIDLRTRKRERRPIFYDKHVVELIKEGSFTPFHLKEHAYATFAVLRMKTNPDMIFTVVNADLYSGNEKHIEKQMYNMIKHINDGSYGKHPLFFLGMINEQTTLVRSLVKNSMNNAVALDTNNTTLSKTTFHNFGRLDDGKQRDFILLKDDEKKFKLNYARILSKLERVDLTHYPVYAIYTMN
ncbi:Y792 [Enterospora canceri]|uniref:Y792 n=1 Tax=Enterospora canceri TaxID=1081671 RepID=A0A1Y1S555_9MICR|nr:Y792 [Enterospora canceri]